MTLTQLAIGKLLEAAPGAGAKSNVLGTLYTVPASKRAYIKEVLVTIKSAAQAWKGQLYILPTGVTDLTTTAAEVTAQARAVAENKGIIPFSDEITGSASVTSHDGDAVVARNTILEAGDKLNFWYYYAAVTPTNLSAMYIVSGDVSDV